MALPAVPYNEATFGERIQDSLIDLVGIGGTNVIESGIGLLDIPSFGAVGKMTQWAGLDTEQWKQDLQSMQSQERQWENQYVSRKFDKGIMEGLGAALDEPAVAIGAIAQSLPIMLATRGAGGGIRAVAPKIKPWLAGAIGEGAIGAGLAAENIRQGTESGFLSPEQVGMSIASGVGTGLIGAFSNKLAKRLGIADPDTIEKRINQGFLRGVGGGILTEGFLEELPQSIQEQVWQNLAEGKKWDEGLNEAAGMGLVAGAAMGGGMNMAAYGSAKLQKTKEDILEKTLTEVEKIQAEEEEAITGKQQAREEGIVAGSEPVSLTESPTIEEENYEESLSTISEQSVLEQENAEEIATEASERVSELQTEQDEVVTHPLEKEAAVAASTDYGTFRKTAQSIYSSVKTFSEFSKQLVKQFGDAVKKYTHKLWNLYKQSAFSKGVMSVEDVSDKKALQKLIQEKNSLIPEGLDFGQSDEYNEKTKLRHAELDKEISRLQQRIDKRYQDAADSIIAKEAGAVGDVKNERMAYKMPAKDNIYGEETSTLDLIEQGKRTATTRSFKLGNGKVGDIVTFEGKPQKYRIVGFEQITPEKAADPEWVKQWSAREGWTPEYFRKIYNKKKTVSDGSWQTIFEKVEEPAPVGAPTEEEGQAMSLDQIEDEGQAYSLDQLDDMEGMTPLDMLDNAEVVSALDEAIDKITLKGEDLERAKAEVYARTYLRLMGRENVPTGVTKPQWDAFFKKAVPDLNQDERAQLIQELAEQDYAEALGRERAKAPREYELDETEQQIAAEEGEDFGDTASAKMPTTSDTSRKDYFAYDGETPTIVSGGEVSTQGPKSIARIETERIVGGKKKKSAKERRETVEQVREQIKIQNAVALERIRKELMRNKNLAKSFAGMELTEIARELKVDPFSSSPKVRKAAEDKIAEYLTKIEADQIIADIESLSDKYPVNEIVKHILNAEGIQEFGVHAKKALVNMSQIKEYPDSLSELMAAEGRVPEVPPTLPMREEEQMESFSEKDRPLVAALKEINQMLPKHSRKINAEAILAVLKNPNIAVNIILDEVPTVAAGQKIHAEVKVVPAIDSPTMNALAKRLSLEYGSFSNKGDKQVSSVTFTPKFARLLTMLAASNPEVLTDTSMQEKVSQKYEEDHPVSERAKHIKEMYKKATPTTKVKNVLGHLFDVVDGVMSPKDMMRAAKIQEAQVHIHEYRRLSKKAKTAIQYGIFRKLADAKDSTIKLFYAFHKGLKDIADGGGSFGSGTEGFTVQKLVEKMSNNLKGKNKEAFDAMPEDSKVYLVQNMMLFTGIDDGLYQTISGDEDFTWGPDITEKLREQPKPDKKTVELQPVGEIYIGEQRVESSRIFSTKLWRVSFTSKGKRQNVALDANGLRRVQEKHGKENVKAVPANTDKRGYPQPLRKGEPHRPSLVVVNWEHPNDVMRVISAAYESEAFQSYLESLGQSSHQWLANLELVFQKAYKQDETDTEFVPDFKAREELRNKLLTLKAILSYENFLKLPRTNKDFFKDIAEQQYPETGMTGQDVYELYLESGGSINVLHQKINAKVEKAKVDIWNYKYYKDSTLDKVIKEEKSKDKTIKHISERFVQIGSMLDSQLSGVFFNKIADKVLKAEIAAKESYNFYELNHQIDQIIKRELGNSGMGTTENFEYMRGLIRIAYSNESIVDAKRNENIKVEVQDLISEKKELDAFEQDLANQVEMVGQIRNPIARKFYELLTKVFKADLVIVSDSSYGTRYIPNVDGRSKIVINVKGEASISKLYAHELFHHIVAKAAPAEYEAFKAEIKKRAKNWDASVAEIIKRRFGSKYNSDNIVKDAEEELLGHLFGRVIGKREFYEGLSGTKIGKTLAGKLIARLAEMVMRTNNAFQSTQPADDLLMFSASQETVGGKKFDDMTDLYYLFADIAGSAFERRNELPAHADTKFYTATEFKKEAGKYVKPPVKAAKGFWRSLFGNVKSWNDFANNVENIAKNWIEKAKWFAGFVEGDVSASNLARTMAENIVYQQKLEVDNVTVKYIKPHLKTFEKMTQEEKAELYDLLCKGLAEVEIKDSDGFTYKKLMTVFPRTQEGKHRAWNLNNHKDIKILKEKFGVSEEVLAAYRDYKKVSDIMYKRLVKIFPDLQYNANHFGQSIRWRTSDRKPLEEGFDWAILPETSKLTGSKHYLKNRNVEKRTMDIVKEGLMYDYIDPNEMLLDYVRNSSKLISFHKEMIVNASKNGMGKRFKNQFTANEEGYVPVNDNATRIYERIENPVGYKIELDDGTFLKSGKKPKGIDNRADAVFDSPEAASDFLTRQQLYNKELVGEIVETAQGERFKTIGYTVYKEKLIEVTDEFGDKVMVPDGNRIYGKKNFETEEEAFAHMNNIQAQDSASRYFVESMQASAGFTEVARMYYKKDLAKLVNRYLGRDSWRDNAVGRKVIGVKNAMTSFEFAWSMFHLFTIGQELFASTRAWSVGKGEGVIGSVSRLRHAVKDSRDIASLMQALMEDKSLADNPQVIKEAERLFGIKDIDMLEMVQNFYLTGGQFHQDPDLRSFLQKKGHMRYSSKERKMVVTQTGVEYTGKRESFGVAVSDTTQSMINSAKEVFEKELREHPDEKVRALLSSFSFATLEGGSAWLMENAIPQIKAAMFAREYLLKVQEAKAASSNGLIDKRAIARDTMFFIEDRFGEVNWQNMWMNPSVKTSLQMMFRSFTWVMGSWKALSKAGIDVVKWGWFNVARGGLKNEEYRFKLTEKGRWGINAFLMHMLTVQAFNVAYTVMLGATGGVEAPDDEDLPFYTDMFFPRYDPADPSARLSVPSYVTEFFKMARHTGMIGDEAEFSKLISGRLSSIITNTFEVYQNSDWQGVAIREEDEGLIKQGVDTLVHIFGVMPISVSTAYKSAVEHGISPQTTAAMIYGMAGMVSAPAAEKRSAATNHAFKLRQEQFRQNLQTEEEFVLKQAERAAVYQYGIGNKKPLTKLVKEGKISQQRLDRLLTRLQYIKGKKNPDYVSNLERAFSTLPTEKKLEVWKYMTENEKRLYKEKIVQSYENAYKDGYQSKDRLKKQREEMKKLGIM